MAKQSPKKSTALAVSKPRALSTAVPKHLQSGKGRGTEALKAADMSMPFLRIGQDKTPAVEAGTVKEGHFYNTLTGEDYGETVGITILHAATGQMRFGDYDQDEGILCRSDDGIIAASANGKDSKGKPTAECASCVLKDWTKHPRTGADVPPECARHSKFFVLVGETHDAAILDLSNTNFPAARKLNTMLGQLAGQGLDAFARTFLLSGKKVTGGKFTYHIIDVSQGEYTDEPTFNKAEKVYESMKGSFKARAAANTDREASPSI